MPADSGGEPVTGLDGQGTLGAAADGGGVDGPGADGPGADGSGPDEEPGFGYVTRVPVRYRDLDPEGHANNAVYATYFEEARLAYFRDVVGVELGRERRVLAALSVAFERRITGGPITVAVRVSDLGRSSLTVRYEVRLPGAGAGDDGSDAAADIAVAATGETVLVTVDGDGGSRSVPSAWRDRIVAHEGLDDATSNGP